ncbi:MAG: hypothetical protein ACXABY_02060 [Candidatus Thorarchaeota archaeon]|jgi:hypothetical protein
MGEGTEDLVVDKYEQMLRELETQDPPVDPLYGVLFVDDFGKRGRTICHDRRDCLNLMRALEAWGPCAGAVMCYWEKISLFDDWAEGEKAVAQYREV